MWVNWLKSYQTGNTDFSQLVVDDDPRDDKPTHHETSRINPSLKPSGTRHYWISGSIQFCLTQALNSDRVLTPQVLYLLHSISLYSESYFKKSGPVYFSCIYEIAKPVIGFKVYVVVVKSLCGTYFSQNQGEDDEMAKLDWAGTRPNMFCTRTHGSAEVVT
jgi:hypothetical protein